MGGQRIVRALIALAARRCGYARRRRVVKFDGSFLFRRYEFLWFDEWRARDGTVYNRPPWWRPFNVFLHLWRPTAGEEFHDHPRWSITICLTGELIEKTPWGERTLRPGAIQFRTRKFIHAFRSMKPEHRGKTWTLFIVGRRNHWQNTYRIKSQRKTGDKVARARAA